MPSFPCNDLKTLTINYSSGSVMPDSGYTVQWRIVGTTDWHTEPNKRANPITISGVPSCYALEARLMVDCGSGLQVVEVFAVQGTSTNTCYTFKLLETASYTYTPCNSTIPQTVYNQLGSEQTICAINNTVTGGAYSRLGTCTI